MKNYININIYKIIKLISRKIYLNKIYEKIVIQYLVTQLKK